MYIKFFSIQFLVCVRNRVVIDLETHDEDGDWLCFVNCFI